MQARRYRSLILKTGCKAFDVEKFRLAHVTAKAKKGSKPKHETIGRTSAVHSHDMNGLSQCTIERDVEGLGILVTTTREPIVSFEIPMASVELGLPEAEPREVAGNRMLAGAMGQTIGQQLGTAGLNANNQGQQQFEGKPSKKAAP